MKSTNDSNRVTVFDTMSRAVGRLAQLRKASRHQDVAAALLTTIADRLFEDYIEVPKGAWSPTADADSIEFSGSSRNSTAATMKAEITVARIKLNLLLELEKTTNRASWRFSIDDHEIMTFEKDDDASLDALCEKSSKRIEELLKRRARE